MTNEQFAEQYWARKKKFDAGKISEEEMQRWENELRAALRKSIQKQKNQEQAKIDREIMETALKGNNK